MEENLNLVILTSDTLFHHIKAVLNFLHLLALQLDDRTTIQVDPLVHIVDQVLLFVHGDLDVFLHVTEGPELILPLVYPHVKSGDPIVETMIHRHHGGLQLLVTPLGGINLIDQTGPDVIQHLNGPIGLSGIYVELPRTSDNLPHPPIQTLMLARSALVIQIIRLASIVAKRMA